MAHGGFHDLVVWQRAMRLAHESYRLSRLLPPDEQPELGRQIRRAATSVPFNIAEGYGRCARPDFRRFLRISRGSLGELETQLLFSRQEHYWPPSEDARALELIDETSRMLLGLIRSLT